MSRALAQMALLLSLTLLFTTSIMFSQDCHFVRPPPAPQAEDFPQPPKKANIRFRGPVIRAFKVQCWTAEPSEPSKCTGGVKGFQKVTIFVPTKNGPTDTREADTRFQQQELSSFSAGGATSILKSADIPPGIFVSFKGHPIFKVTRVQYPTKTSEDFASSLATGVKVEADFEHEATSGATLQKIVHG